MKKYIIIIAVALAAISCAKESSDATKPRLVFTAGFSDVKVSDNSGKMQWEAGDVIRISNGTAWEDVTLAASDITADGYSATFATSTLDAAPTFYAAYPAANCGLGLSVVDGNVLVWVPQDQTPDNVFTCVASCDFATGRNLNFIHPMALIYFTTTNENIAKLVFHSNGSQPVSGPMNVNPSTGEASWDYQGDDAITVPVSEKKAWIEVSPLETLANGFSVYAYDSSDDLLGIVYRNTNRKFERNTRYTLNNPSLSAPAAMFDGYYYTSFDNALAAFNSKNSGTLTWTSSTSGSKTVTAENGVLDMNSCIHSGCFFMQNNTGTIMIKNGSFSSTGDCFDGKSGFGDEYSGKIILENVTVSGVLWTDGHEFEIRSGVYNSIRNTYLHSAPGLVTIKGGCFRKQLSLDYPLPSGWSRGSFVVEGGKFAYDPTLGENVSLGSGKAVYANEGADSGVYPYEVR